LRHRGAGLLSASLSLYGGSANPEQGRMDRAVVSGPSGSAALQQNDHAPLRPDFGAAATVCDESATGTSMSSAIRCRA
jgi:hypothetical protein